MSQDFHPAYIAAAYMAQAREQLILSAEQREHGLPVTGCLEKPALPSYIGGHPWYLFIDPEISSDQLDFVLSVLNADNQFLCSLLAG